MATGNCTTSRKKRLTAAADGHRLPCARRVLRSRSKANPRIPISDLGDDLLVGILSRLPNARSVFRCKSVCKRWDSLISDPNFRLHFVSHHRNEGDDDDREPALLPTDKPEAILSFLPVPDEIRKHFIVVDSFNDMVLCGFRWAKEDESSYPELGRLFFVCNPFTRQWVALPLAPERSDPCLVSTESLVCEPRSNTTHNSNGQVISIDSEYRFRVVHLCGTAQAPKIDVFCSESGEWMTDVIDMDRNLRFIPGRLMSCCNGKLCWLAVDMIRVAMWDPFRPHIPPTSIWSPCLAGRVGAQVWASHGDLHKIEVYPDVLPGLPWSVLCVYRLTEEGIGTADGKCRELYKASWMDLLRSVREEYGDMELHNVLALHPSKPEIVFLELSSPLAYGRLIFSCNLRTMELKFVADQVPSIRWKVLQPRFTCWPTPIPSYEKLRGMYDGTYSCLVQSCSKESPTPLINGNFTLLPSPFLPALSFDLECTKLNLNVVFVAVTRCKETFVCAL
ncbi:unnamed protein product [Linum tenue]|uniref:F-box domain-containing protein n=1 Tax=Linum tenue TaxID=586396 RepID=A0AAV0JQU6_9ROSI|nr:unnamed protein product [Linum tenue]